MKRTGSIVMTSLLVVMLTAAIPAQTQTQTPEQPVTPVTPPAAVRPPDRSDLRHQIYVMEGALARAVAFGAKQLTRELRTVAPEMMALSGEPQARGVYLDGYGVFFDVSVPVLHQSMMWSLRTMLGQDEKGVAEALSSLKDFAKGSSGAQRAAIENAIARLELQLGPLRNAGGPEITTAPGSRPVSEIGTVGPAFVRPDMPVPAPSQQVPLIDRKYLQDPNAINRAYTESVQTALVDAMIDYSLPMALGPEEYLTVGARDNMQRDTLAPPDPFEEVITLLLRIKGADLAAYSARQIDRQELRRRVQVREF